MYVKNVSHNVLNVPIPILVLYGNLFFSLFITTYLILKK